MKIDIAESGENSGALSAPDHVARLREVEFGLAFPCGFLRFIVVETWRFARRVLLIATHVKT
jgi:hypothetical protein